MRTDFETSGDIRDVDLLAAFVGFWRSRTPGAISFSRAASSAAFGLAAGEIVSVSSSEARFESSAILVRAGKLDAAALERLSIPEGTDGALAALQTGILTKREWRWGEKIRAIEILADLLAWPDGKYYFDAEARPVAGEFTLTIPRLLLELFLRSRDRNLIEHQLGPSDASLVRSADFDREFSSFGLTADAESVVRLIDGHASAEDIARAAPAEDFAVRKLLAALTTLGLVTAAPQSAVPVETIAEPGAVDEGRSDGEVGTIRDRDEEDEDAEEEDEEDQEVGEEEDATRELATRRVPTLPASGPDASREVPSDWDVPSFEPARRGSAFDFDPPGSTTPLEAFPLPGEIRETRAHAPTGHLPETSDSPDRAGLHGSIHGSEPGSEPELDSRAGAYASSPMDPLDPAASAPREGRTGTGMILGLVLVGLVVAIAAVMYFRSRPVSSARSGTDVPVPASASTSGEAAIPPGTSPLPAAAATAPVATPARSAAARPATALPATPVPERRNAAFAPTPLRVAAVRATATSPAAAPRTTGVPALRPTGTGLAVRPAASASPVRPAPTRVAAAAAKPLPEAKAGAGAGDRGGWNARASKDARRLAGEKTMHYSIQLELACEVPSLSDAFQHDRPAGSMWLLATPHGGRDCFRVLWGRYPSIDAAKRAKSGIPSFFSTDRNHPAVVSVR